ALAHSLAASALAQTADPADAPDLAAQAEDNATTAEATDEGAIDAFDQTVPVADEDPALEDSPEDEAVDLNDRDLLIAEFERFKALQEAGSYDEALNVAKRVVELSITQTGPTSNDTARSLSNLGLVQHRVGNYEAAEQNFQAAIDIIRDNEDKLSNMLINPLKGLGAAQLANGRPDLASETYSQAVHISHVNSGPHNLEQVEILEALAETNLRIGEIASAKNNQDMIYALTLRHYSGNSLDLIEPLMRRAMWQRRTGFVLDERATYRRIIRIIETKYGKDDLRLIDPLMQLGESYFYVDTSESNAFQSTSVTSGELHFKRAERIAEEHPEATWEMLVNAKLALADHYNFRGDQGRARKVYAEVWDLLSTDDERLGTRQRELEQLVALNEDAVARYMGSATRKDRAAANSEIREGRIVVTYDVSSRGRVGNLRIIEEEPDEFDDLRRTIVRELRTRIFRPRHVDGQPVDTPNQVFRHTFYYLQDELDQMRDTSEDEAT
ncbi:MAG: tetratricopeptide repeat protein, partial [Woeseiaceae bacterium]|nr:tetratricopeptide repeat protein [Woeseiaceae bacterium]